MSADQKIAVLAVAITAIGALVTAAVGIPAWLSWNATRKAARQLEVGLEELREAFASAIRGLRLRHGLTLESVARRVAPRLSADDVAGWEADGTVPFECLGGLLDAVQMSEWDYRALALKHLSAQEYKTHLEPLL